MKNEQDKISLDDKIINWVSSNLFYSFLILVLIIFIILFSVFGITALIYKDKTILNPNEIGDAIGGMTAPIIGLFSAFLVYIAFRAQIKANEELQKQNEFILFDRYKTLLNELAKKVELIKMNSHVYSMDNNYIYGVDSIHTFFSTTFNQYNISTKGRFLKEYRNDVITYYKFLLELLEKISNSNLIELEKKYLYILLGSFYIDKIRDSYFYAEDLYYTAGLIGTRNEDDKKKAEEILDTVNSKLLPPLIEFNLKYKEIIKNKI